MTVEVRFSRHSRALLNSLESREALYAVAEALFARLATPAQSQATPNQESRHARS